MQYKISPRTEIAMVVGCDMKFLELLSRNCYPVYYFEMIQNFWVNFADKLDFCRLGPLIIDYQIFRDPLSLLNFAWISKHKKIALWSGVIDGWISDPLHVRLLYRKHIGQF